MEIGELIDNSSILIIVEACASFLVPVFSFISASLFLVVFVLELFIKKKIKYVCTFYLRLRYLLLFVIYKYDLFYGLFL